MQRILEQHIDTKSVTPTTVQRWVKLYIDHFDPDKSYLLEQEVLPYLSLSDAKIQKILQNLQKKDFSDFIQLNQILQKSIFRAQEARKQIKPLFLQNQLTVKREKNTSFAKTEQELLSRQTQRLYQFFITHKKRAVLNTEGRKDKLFSLFEKKLHHFEKAYLSQDENLFSLHILKAFAKSLDAHTAFFSEEEAGEMRKSLEKQFEGIGVILVESIDGAIISEILPKSPAHESGKIHPQDLIVEIDGKWVKDLTFEEVLDTMKRRENENITLGLCCLHDQTEWQEDLPISHVTLTSKALSLDQERIAFSYEPVEGGILAKITLYSFYENKNGINSEKDIRNALQELEKKGKIKGVILDLRNNAGGFLHQAVKVSGLFISNGVVVISKYGKAEKHYLRVVGNERCFTGPCIVLTSKLSASAAEIVAQALQDYGIALVVGDERTFGKGTIQYQTVTQNKADAYFKVTVGRYYTVSGKSTQIDGVIADIVVPSEYASYNFGERFLDYPLPADHIHSAFVDSLEDLEESAKVWFEKFYLPKQQQKQTVYQKMLPVLKQNSLYRQTHDLKFKNYLEEQKNHSAEGRKKDKQEDIQMIEASNILKDMILLESQQKAS